MVIGIMLVPARVFVVVGIGKHVRFMIVLLMNQPRLLKQRVG